MVEIVVQILRPLPRSATQERPFHREPPTLPSTHHVQVSAIGKDGNMDARPLIVRILTICITVLRRCIEKGVLCVIYWDSCCALLAGVRTQ